MVAIKENDFITEEDLRIELSDGFEFSGDTPEELLDALTGYYYYEKSRLHEIEQIVSEVFGEDIAN